MVAFFTYLVVPFKNMVPGARLVVVVLALFWFIFLKWFWIRACHRRLINLICLQAVLGIRHRRAHKNSSDTLFAALAYHRWPANYQLNIGPLNGALSGRNDSSFAPNLIVPNQRSRLFSIHRCLKCHLANWTCFSGVLALRLHEEPTKSLVNDWDW